MNSKTFSPSHKFRPCRSPYCECTPGKCLHPGCYDARHELYEHPKPIGFNVRHAWPFPVYPNPKDKPDGKKPKFNPNNHDDAPL
ncbi:hypothetical protein UFOVP121_70 [uncultured Caudovirales phage]|uniref:Uncharacterized protein n=1 Tax=uncultured Caudovirales phage TaxID=2100421 RepID=A0A6J5L9L6_9CAUD|nr:hypothetical protein UFOVP121_70 [uncultured Caudovirales phage]CAB4135103.1 hypothetical protein UFOVP277_75 [uncultured Caudovirales phage]